MKIIDRIRFYQESGMTSREILKELEGQPGPLGLDASNMVSHTRILIQLMKDISEERRMAEKKNCRK